MFRGSRTPFPAAVAGLRRPSRLFVMSSKYQKVRRLRSALVLRGPIRRRRPALRRSSRCQRSSPRPCGNSPRRCCETSPRTSRPTVRALPPAIVEKAWVERALTPRSLRIFHEEIARSGERGQKLVASARDRRSARPRRGSGPNGCYVHSFVQCRAYARFSRACSRPGAPSARLRRRRPPRPSPVGLQGEVRGEGAAAPGRREARRPRRGRLRATVWGLYDS